MEAKLAKGDIAFLEYDAWIVGPGEVKTLHETTHADVAKAADKYDEKRAYAPIPVVVGHERVLKGLDEALLGVSVGETKEVVIPPGKGAGERDPKLVRLLTIREFLRKDIEPAVGKEVVLDGRRGTITAVTAGRVRVDFNNPLAGPTLLYKVTVARRADGVEDRIRSILEMDYGLGEQFRIVVKENEADVVLPDVCKTDERWFVSKFRVVADVREFAGVPKLRFVEEYERPEDKQAEKPAAPEAGKEVAKPAEEKPASPRRAKGKGKPKARTAAERAEEEILPEEREKQPEEL